MKPKTLAMEFGDLLLEERRKVASTHAATADVSGCLSRIAALLDEAEKALEE